MELSTTEAQVWSLTALPLCRTSLQSVQVKMSWESHFLSSVKTHTHTQNRQHPHERSRCSLSDEALMLFSCPMSWSLCERRRGVAFLGCAHMWYVNISCGCVFWVVSGHAEICPTTDWWRSRPISSSYSGICSNCEFCLHRHTRLLCTACRISRSMNVWMEHTQRCCRYATK